MRLCSFRLQSNIWIDWGLNFLILDLLIKTVMNMYENVATCTYIGAKVEKSGYVQLTSCSCSCSNAIKSINTQSHQIRV